jgi:LSD1 subclass zinc finger protein
MEIEVLLSCGHILVVPVESVIHLPRIGDQVRCAICETHRSINQVGQPYHVKKDLQHGDNQTSILGDQ